MLRGRPGANFCIGSFGESASQRRSLNVLCSALLVRPQPVCIVALMRSSAVRSRSLCERLDDLVVVRVRCLSSSESVSNLRVLLMLSGAVVAAVSFVLAAAGGFEFPYV